MGVNIDPNRQVDNIMRFYVYIQTWIWTGHVVWKFEYDQDTQTFVSFEEYTPGPGNLLWYEKGYTYGYEFSLPKTYVNTETYMEGRISPWENFWVMTYVDRRSADHEVVTFSDYFNDYSESMLAFWKEEPANYQLFAGEPEAGSDESRVG